MVPPHEEWVPLTAELDPKSPVAEAYRTLRTNLQFTSLDRPVKSILLTSAGPGEGKSTVCANLAVVMAQAGVRVAAVGVDLRRPALHRLLGVDNSIGLTHVLVGRAPLESALCPTSVSGLTVLPAGPVPPNPAELLASQTMRDVVRALAERFDVVLYDAPPVIAVADACVLAPMMDGVLLVIASGAVPREVAREAKAQLEKVKARILGAVLNRVDAREGYNYYYYYYSSSHEVAPTSQPGVTKPESAARRRRFPWLRRRSRSTRAAEAAAGWEEP